MMAKRKGMQRILSLILVIALVLSVGGTGFAYEDSSITTESGAKINVALAEHFSTEKYVNYIIKLKEQGDLNNAVKAASNVSLLAKDTPSKAKQRAHNYVLNELVETAEDTQDSLLSYIEKQQKDGKVQSYESFYIINAIAICSTEDVMRQIAARSDVEAVTEDKTYHLQYIKPDQTALSLQSMEGSREIPWNLERISVGQAWSAGYDGTNVVVANMDSGVDYNHPALTGSWRGNNPDLRVYSWLDAVTGKATTESSRPVDGDGHGTHVMGSMVGAEATGANKIGVAPGANWMAARVFNDEGETSSTIIMRAGQWLLAPTDENNVPHAEMAPDVINNSWGGDSSDEFFRDVVSAWRHAGIVPIFSAGNTSYTNLGGIGSVGSPASYPEAIAVGAIDRSDRIAYFSLLGPSSYGEVKPEVSAPGVNIRSSLPGGSYGLLSGTSMASPHVAGVAALILDANPSLTVDQVESILKDTATSLTDSDYVASPNNAYGYGKVDAYRAVKKAEPSGSGLGTINGKTTVTGEDAQAPIIDHIPVKTLFKVYDSIVDAKLTDNVGIAKSTLYLKSTEEDVYHALPMLLSSGNKLEGVYQVSIPVSLMAETGMNYYIEAEDTEGNKTATSTYTASVSKGVQRGYLQDFEDNLDGFSFDGTTPMWEWGAPLSGPTAAASGEKVVATNLDGSYEGLVDSVMVMPVIDLTDGNAAALTFQQWYDLGDSYGIFNDTAEVWIGELPAGSSDPADIDFNLTRIYKNSQKSWSQEYIDLAPYKGKKIVVMFGLRYGGWSDQSKLGWYIDDIAVTDPSEDVPPTPYQYLKFQFRDGVTAQISFNKINDSRISSYVMYRSESKTGPFEPVATVLAGDIQYSSVSLTDIPLPQAKTYYYYATSKIGNNESGPTQIFSHTFTTGETVIKYDFESGDQGWYSIASDTNAAAFTRGELDYSKYSNHNMPNESTSKGKNADSPTVWGTELHDYRKANKTYVLESPTIDLSDKTKAELYYQNWFNTFGVRGFEWEEYYNDDNGYIYYSADGGETWDKVFTLNSTAIKAATRVRGAWYLDTQSIPSKYLTDQFRVRFVFEATAETSGAGCGGWYIDDVEITDLSSDIGGPGSVDDLEPFDFQKIKANGSGAPILTEKAGGSLPIPADITVKETGIGTRSELGSGDYKLSHPAGNYTLVFEAQGYKTQEYPITIVKGETVNLNVNFRKLAESSLEITIKNAGGRAVEGAKVNALGASGMVSGTTDSSGKALLEQLYEGSYHMRITASGYLPAERTVAIEEGEIKSAGVVTLIAINPGEQRTLLYDDGTAVTKGGFSDNGGTYGVKMMPEGKTRIDAVQFYFTDGDSSNLVKNPVGKEFLYTIYDDSKGDGFAGRILAGPFRATVAATEGWTEISLPESVVADGVFYVAYTQVGSKNEAPRIGIDGSADATRHSFLLNGGAWRETSSDGSVMIRSLVTQVEAVKFLGVSINPASIQIKEGGAQALIINALDSNQHTTEVTEQSVFTSSNESVASVDEKGIVKGVSAGDVTITATFKDPSNDMEYSAKAQITVVKNKADDSSGGGGGGISGISVKDEIGSVLIGGKIGSVVSVNSGVATVNFTSSNVSEYTISGILDIKAKNIQTVKVALPLEKLAGSTDINLKTNVGEFEIPKAFLSELRVKYGDSLTLVVSGLNINFEKDGKEVGFTGSKTPFKVGFSHVDDNMIVKDRSGKAVAYSGNSNGTLKMLCFGSGSYQLVPGGKTFEDISGHWGNSSISFVADREIFGGVGDGRFQPDSGMTRAMFAVALANLEKADLSGYSKAAFADADIHTWYGKSVAWAYDQKFVAGVGGESFAPDQKITREQIAVLLDRYLLYKGFDLQATQNAEFSDQDQISSWATEAVSAVRAYGIVGGRTTGEFDPAGYATRAEVATMIKNLVDVALQ